MSLIYKALFASCLEALIPNPYTVSNLPSNQRVYIFNAASQECKGRLKEVKMIECVKNNMKCEDL
jgi:hypothetical protein